MDLCQSRGGSILQMGKLRQTPPSYCSSSEIISGVVSGESGVWWFPNLATQWNQLGIFFKKILMSGPRVETVWSNGFKVIPGHRDFVNTS